MAIKIEKGIPLPAHLHERVGVGPLPLKDMKVGDSIVVEADTRRELERKLKSIRMRLSRFAKKAPHYKFRIAKETDASGTHLRIWRVSRAN
jgi:hypothetical protein